MTSLQKENLKLQYKLEYLTGEYQRVTSENMTLFAENQLLKGEYKSAPVSEDILARESVALEKARTALAMAIYQSECGVNAGLRTIFANQADWLSTLVYLATKQFEQEAT